MAFCFCFVYLFHVAYNSSIVVRDHNKSGRTGSYYKRAALPFLSVTLDTECGFLGSIYSLVIIFTMHFNSEFFLNLEFNGLHIQYAKVTVFGDFFPLLSAVLKRNEWNVVQRLFVRGRRI